ncbi:YccF domain-containing protein [Pleomorphomonas sp. JP5]|uniref:YccF domain-containing protein n=1 Tax=Pleomorphomonas sp. JP5 TaxID=2942998 RepID=UPI002043F214|nr:YccF domain-containing protein [Pleomorphomonas sp. JP5]MCM5557312.1 YccF family protein [Pleomorphomonas sp. JP5]
MRFAGRFMWFALGGVWTAGVWLVGAAIFGRIPGGEPLSRAAVEMAGLGISPFGRDAVHIRELGGQDPAPTTTAARVLGPILNVMWMLTFGLILCAAYLILGALCCLTVRGLSLGRQCFKLAGISLWPAGQRVISTDLATVPRQQAAVERFARARLRQSSRDDGIDHPGDVPPAAAR